MANYKAMNFDTVIGKLHELAAQMVKMPTSKEGHQLADKIWDIACEWNDAHYGSGKEVYVSEKWEEVNGEQECIGFYIEDDWYMFPEWSQAEDGKFVEDSSKY